MKKISTLLITLLFAFTGYAQFDYGPDWEAVYTHVAPEGSPLEYMVTDEISSGWDIDKDGLLEFIIVKDHTMPDGDGPRLDNGVSLWLYEATVSGSYELAWSWIDTTIDNGNASYPIHAVTDLDGDGNLEISLGFPYDDDAIPAPLDPDRFLVFEGPVLPSTPTATWNFGASAGSDTRPSAMAVEDFDGDGVQEVAMAFRSYSDASTNDAVMIFSLDGEFSGSTTLWKEELIDTLTDFGSIYSTGIVSDVDGDGVKEACFASYSTHTIYFWEGAGSADTYNQVTLTPGSEQSLRAINSLGAYDVDKDGSDEIFVAYDDLVVVDNVVDLSSVDSTNIYTVITDKFDNSKRGLSVGYFDGNNKLDIMTADSWDGTFSWLEHDGTSLVTDPAGWEKSSFVFSQEGENMRSYAVSFASSGGNGGTSSDMNGDGKPDLFVGYGAGDSSETYYFTALTYSGIYIPEEKFDYGPDWEAVYTHVAPEGSPLEYMVTDEISSGWDIDKDGLLEFIIVKDHTMPDGDGPRLDNGVSLWLYEATVSGSYELAWSWIDTTIDNGNASYPIHAVTDLDGDGNLEISLGFPYDDDAIPAPLDPDRFLVFEGPVLPSTPTATWNFGASAGSDTRPSAMAVEDFDGDGVQEVAMAFRSYSDASTNDAVMIFSLDGEFSGSTTLWKEELIDTLTDFGSIYSTGIVSDVDGDGVKEACFASYSTHTIYFWEGAGSADTYNQVTLTPGSEQSLRAINSLGAYDVDKDGSDEIFVAYDDLVVVDNVVDLSSVDSTNIYTVITDKFDNSKRGLSVGYFDGNNKLDIMTADSWDGTFSWLEHDGTSLVTDPAGWEKSSFVFSQEGENMRSYAVSFASSGGNGGTSSDMNGDGKPDLFVGYGAGDSSETYYFTALTYSGVPTNVNSDGLNTIPKKFALEQNYPNPFNPSTNIKFNLPYNSKVSLRIYNILGELVDVLVNQGLNAGYHSIEWNANNKMIASGMYIYRIEATSISGKEFYKSKKMLLLK